MTHISMEADLFTFARATYNLKQCEGHNGWTPRGAILIQLYYCTGDAVPNYVSRALVKADVIEVTDQSIPLSWADPDLVLKIAHIVEAKVYGHPLDDE